LFQKSEQMAIENHTIWVDGDGCPQVIREILYRAAERCQIPLKLVANRPIHLPRSPWISRQIVAGGFDIADNHIVAASRAGDIAITSDLPLALALIQKGVFVLGHRGERHSRDSIRAKVQMRDFNETLRASGIQSGGPSPLSQSDRLAFANQLDRLLNELQRMRKPPAAEGAEGA
jgi:uncharacterized protein